MTTIVVGGHSRKVGKTAITAGLIRAFSEYPWTAAKITSHWHGESPANDSVIYEERSREGGSDSSRFLAAGATRSFWIRVREERSQETLPRMLQVLQSSSFVIIESNWILRHIQPDLYILVLKCDVDDFKESAHETLGRADALVLVNPDSPAPSWENLLREKAADVPIFSTPDPFSIPVGLVDLVRKAIRD
jgi:hypothetical protein